MKKIIGKMLCEIFGHPNREHFHKETDVITCKGGCEKYQDVFWIFPCPRCGYKEFSEN